MSGQSTVPTIKTCAACGKKDSSLKLCLGCREVHYCGRDCQVAHRKEHKSFCKKKEQSSKKAAVAAKTGLSDQELDKPVVVFFVDRFVQAHMAILLGSPDPNTTLWDMLFKKKGAKQRIQQNILAFTVQFMSKNPEYQTAAAMKRLLELRDYNTTSTIKKEPILAAMVEELHRFLDKEEGFFSCD